MNWYEQWKWRRRNRGNTTKGIEQHIEWAMAATSAEPESRVLAHPIKIAAGNWTAVTGTLPGNGTMITLAHWEDGRIAEEYKTRRIL
jgi:hypothetical protein